VLPPIGLVFVASTEGFIFCASATSAANRATVSTANRSRTVSLVAAADVVVAAAACSLASKVSIVACVTGTRQSIAVRTADSICWLAVAALVFPGCIAAVIISRAVILVGIGVAVVRYSVVYCSLYKLLNGVGKNK
jgi:hypothetical protein